MKYGLLGLLLYFISYAQAFGTEGNDTWGIGTELQAYPAGLIPGARGELFLGPMQNVNMRIAYNVARRQDFGKHDDERGGGWGAGIGYRRYGVRDRLPFFAGIRIDWWELGIDWQQKSNAIQTSGTTRISVLQPTGEFGYDWRIHESWSLIATVSVGAEINLVSQGEPVGEGAILLIGLNTVYRFGGS